MYLKVEDWRIFFSEQDDPVAFLERLLEIFDSRGINPDLLLPQLPILLRGKPALWFRNNRHRWSTWKQFASDFRSFYFPLNYIDDLEAQISRRLHRSNETVNDYITELQTLIRRHGDISPEQEVRWLYQNLLPQFRQMIRHTDFHDVFTLSQQARETESLLNELQHTQACSVPPRSSFL